LPAEAKRGIKLPEKIGKYQIVSRLGRGAMGHVYKARDPILNRDVAVKVIASNLADQEDLRKRFVREAQAAAQLNHQNIVTIYDFGEDDDGAFIAMELLEGQDLKDSIGSAPGLSLDEKLGLMEQMCDGLGFAHSKGVIHRDLKPSNLHVKPDGRLKILDFGLARVAQSDFTQSGTVMGTPHYMSPEQVQGEVVDTRSEVFSLGVIFYELLSNEKPFNAESIHAIMFQVIQCNRVPLKERAPDLPQRVIDVVEKALSREPADRYQDALELRAALAGLRDGSAETGVSRSQPGEASPVSATIMGGEADVTAFAGSGPSIAGVARPSSREALPARRGNPISWLAGLAAALVLAGGLTFFLLRPAPVETASRAAQTETASVSAAPGVVQERPALDPAQAPAATTQSAPPDPAPERAVPADMAQAPTRSATTPRPRPAVAAPRPAPPVTRAAAATPDPAIAAAARAEATQKLEAAARVWESARDEHRSADVLGRAEAGRALDLEKEARRFTIQGDLAGAEGAYRRAAELLGQAGAMVERERVALAVPAAAPVPTAPPASHEDEIRALLGRYEQALETEDIALFRAVKPNLSPEQEKTLRLSFAAVSAHEVDLDVIRLDVRGSRADVRVRRRDTVTVNGGRQSAESDQTISLELSPTGWVITELAR